MKHEYIKDWNEFWEFYIDNVKLEVGPEFDALQKSLKFGEIGKRLDWITTDEFNKINELIRTTAQVPKKVDIVYDPKAETFYSKFNMKTKKYEIAYPTFTKFMMYWEPAMKFAFRHELGHILRGDCTIDMNGYKNVKNANCCMDIRINGVLNRQSMLETYYCLYYNLDNPMTQEKWDDDLLVPEVQFPKINLDWDEEERFMPSWTTISDYYSKAQEEQQEQGQGQGQGQPQEGEGEQGQGQGEPQEGEGQGNPTEDEEGILDDLKNAGVNGEDANSPKFREGEDIDKDKKPDDGDVNPEEGSSKEKLDDIRLKQKIKRTIDNLEKMKSKYSDKIQSSEIEFIDKKIEELEQILN